MVTCIACEGFPSEHNNPCGLCGTVAKTAEDEENKRLMAKTKNHKSWSWNATYHRKCIKDLERQLEYHHSKVEICKKHVKDDAK